MPTDRTGRPRRPRRTPTPEEIASRSAPNPAPEIRRQKLAIALSGGGYRAMLYHLGALRRLNEFGLLSVMDRMSTVSGGSIIGAVVAIHWPDLGFDAAGVAQNFDQVEREVFKLASKTIDVQAGLIGLLPGVTGADHVAKVLDGPLGHKMLGDVSGNAPRFTFNTTNMESGNLFRWAAPYAADWQIGQIKDPEIKLSTVVAASAAFPPILSPLRIPVPGKFVPFERADREHSRKPPLQAPTELWLTDGGVYDNLGLQNVESYTTVLVSDAGAPFGTRARIHSNLVSQAQRTMLILNEQVGRQRRRGLVNEMRRGQRLGTLWTIETMINEYTCDDALDCPIGDAWELAAVRTRLKRLPEKMQFRLANWGYASADAAVRSFVEPSLPAPTGFAYPGGI